MEKVINLKNDQVFRHAVPYNDEIDYTQGHLTDAKLRADDVREAICDLVIRGKLDAIDLKIISARDCSPMPTQSKVSRIIGIPRRTVCQRIRRFKALFARV